MRKITIRQLVCIAILFALITLISVAIYLQQKTETISVAKPVESFLTEFLDPNYETTSEHSVFAFYFSEWTVENSEELENSFADVMTLWSAGYTSFELEAISNNFCIIRLYSESGDLIPPPIGFWYVLTFDGSKIKTWEVCRLQPFSRYDSEFSTFWEALYGY